MQKRYCCQNRIINILLSRLLGITRCDPVVLVQVKGRIKLCWFYPIFLLLQPARCPRREKEKAMGGGGTPQNNGGNSRGDNWLTFICAHECALEFHRSPKVCVKIYTPDRWTSLNLRGQPLFLIIKMYWVTSWAILASTEDVSLHARRETFSEEGWEREIRPGEAGTA